MIERLLTSSLNKDIFAVMPHTLFIRDLPVVSNERQERVQSDGSPPNTVERRVIASTELLQGAVEVLIDHSGEIYRLRLTRSGKLILQK